MSNLSKFIVALGAGAFLLVLLFSQARSTNEDGQPISFDHKKHAQRHVRCEDCHTLYKDHSTAGIPGVNKCIRCHEEVVHKTKETDKIQEYRELGEEIPWSRIYRMNPDIYGLDRLFWGLPLKAVKYVYDGKDRFNFSHRRHAVSGMVECDQCHGDVANMDEPITKLFEPIEMKRCIYCHKEQEKKVSTDCATCHR